LAVALAGCQTGPSLDSLPPLEASTVADDGYRLGHGDHLALIVYGAQDLSANDLNVAADGTIALPLVGTVKVIGLTLEDLTEVVREKLMTGYLHDPKVSLQILVYRPFYILGEVKTPGEYPYVPGMTVTTAVARAGGFTFRAYEDGFSVIRNGTKYHAIDSSKLLPDDVVNVPARIF
jgi:polysaccharide export outer membrane protein